MFHQTFFGNSYWKANIIADFIDFCLLCSLQRIPGLVLQLCFAINCCLLVLQSIAPFSQFSLLLCLHTWLLGENTGKCITCTILIEKEITKNISYILQFIDSTRFQANSLSNLVNNLSEGIHRIKCKFGHDDKKCEINISIVTIFSNIQALKMI